MATHLADPEHNPSFTRGLFLGEIREDLVFPFPELAAADKESLNAILDSFRGWASASVNSARLDHDGRFGDDVRAGMAEFHILSRVVELGPREHHVIVSGIPSDDSGAEVRMAVEETVEDAERQRDFLVMSLATELRAHGHAVMGIVE